MSLSLQPALSRPDVEHIHIQSLDLLERVGIGYQTPRALGVLERFGCPVDYERRWASLPRGIVEWALEQAPRIVTLEARDPARNVVLNGRRPHHTTDSQGTQALDFETGTAHESTLVDLERGLLFADALDMIEIVNVMVAANDVPAHGRTIQHFATAFTQTNKHVRTGVLHAGQVPYILALAKAATGEEAFRPIFSAVDCTISPLMHDGPMTEACIELAELQVPIMVYPMPLAGGTSPVTLAGTLLLHNVEFLSGLVLFQAVNPGTPIIYGCGASQLDMLTGRYEGGATVHGLHLASAEMGSFYHLPVNLGGLSTASRELDVRYGYEATAACLLAYLARADEVYSAGLLGSAQILSLTKMVLDNHLAHQMELMVRPVPVDEEHLQAALIERVGIGGHYLNQKETRRYTHEEYFPVWPPAGKTMLEIARAEAERILTGHQPPPLPKSASEEIETILCEAGEELAKMDTEMISAGH